MREVFGFFDAYTLRARVFPALVAGLPTLALLAVVVPWSDPGPPHAIAVAAGLILLFAFADVARRTGRHVQTKLGTGTTPEQWRRDNPDIPETAKDLYRAFVAHKLRRSAPTADEELADPARARDFYLGAGTWLRQQTRDRQKFNILFGENVTYGFRRNLLGLKVVALLCNTTVAAFSGAILQFRPPYFAALPDIDEKLVAVLAADLLHSLYLLLAVSAAGVREASRAYGRELIVSCEALMTQRLQSPHVGSGANGKS